MSRLTINSNVSSLNTQRNLANATKNLSASFTRLSSGLRINRSVDDAAGLSISESLKADTRILNQGVRNLNDGLSLLSIADGALNELSNITIRLGELASQSANGTIGLKQRQAIDQEAQSLAQEYNRIARTTEFNGLGLFNGDLGELALSAGGGRQSLIVSDFSSGLIGDGTFQAATSIVTGVGPRSVSVTDLNGDGLSDLIVADDNSGAISTHIGKGDGTFEVRQSIVAGSPYSVAVGDFNGDGIVDLVSSDDGAAVLRIFIGNGDGTFKPQYSITSGTGPRHVDVRDLNDDGILDLVSTDTGNATLSIFMGNGDGTFQARQTVTTGSQPNATIVADLNGDNIFDLVSADQFSNQLSIFFGNGDGTFQARQSINTGAFPADVAVGDFNGDGFNDLVSADSVSDRLSLFLGNGDGTFQARLSFATGDNPTNIQVGDFNGDGLSDIVSADYSSNNLSLFLSNGDGTFQARQSLATQFGPNGLAIGDFNNDGVSDIVSTDFVSNRLSLFLGNSEDGILFLPEFSLKTMFEARTAINTLSAASDRISNRRGEIGSLQSRVEFAANTLKTTALGYQDANSRIVDADVAEESAKLLAQQIIQQTAVKILEQVNLQPSLVLKLLGNNTREK